MGCVQSDQHDRRDRRHSRDQRYQPQHHHQPRQQQQHRQQHNQRQPQHQNGHAKQVSRSNSRDKKFDDHLYENVDKDRIIAKTSPTRSPVDDADTQFRRQHFDRNSCLRHSKKRKKSSSTSNPNSPAVMNGTTTTIGSATTSVPATTPVTTTTSVTTTIVSNSRTGKTNSVENSPTNNNRLVNINGKTSSSNDDVFKFDETEIVDIDEAIAQDSDDELQNDHELQQQLEEEEQRYQQQLLQEKHRQQQQLLQEQLRQQQQQQQHQQKQRSKSTVDPPAKKISTNSVSNLPRVSLPKEGPPPHKVVQQRAPKISSGDRPVSQTRPENGQTRLVLRTRRQVEEEQRNGGRGKDEEPIDDSEDCGRLI